MVRRAPIAALFLAVPLFGQTFDFENGIADWKQSGEAFQHQPYCKAITSTTFTTSKVGGSYWKNLAYPLGQHGNCLVTTIARPFDTPTGTLTSQEFLLDPNTPFFSFRRRYRRSFA
jgi:hypothetical protein